MVLQKSDRSIASRVGVSGAVAIGTTLTVNTPAPSGTFTVQSRATMQVPIIARDRQGRLPVLEIIDYSGNRVVRLSRTGSLYVVTNGTNGVVSGVFAPLATHVYTGTESNHVFCVITTNVARTQWEPNCNIGLIKNQAVFGNGVGVIAIGNDTAPPTTNPYDGIVVYSEGGAPKWRSPTGKVTVGGAA
jgi:hypothetical protein